MSPRIRFPAIRKVIFWLASKLGWIREYIESFGTQKILVYTWTVPASKVVLKNTFCCRQIETHFNKNKLRFLVDLHSLGLSHNSLCESDIGSMYHILCLCPTLSQKHVLWPSLALLVQKLSSALWYPI
jgi:hypothetical protein